MEQGSDRNNMQAIDKQRSPNAGFKDLYPSVDGIHKTTKQKQAMEGR